MNLMKNQYSSLSFEYTPLLNRINGSQLESQKTKHLLRKEYQYKKPEVVIFIRDLDGLKSETTKLNKRKEYFTEFNSVVDKKGIYLLHIYEIEALIFSDIETFNSEYS